MFKYKFIIWLHSHLSQETNIENKLESLLESLDTFPKDLLRHADIYTTFISDEQIAASEALSKILKSKNITNGINLIEKLKNKQLGEFLPDFVIGDDEQIYKNYGIPLIQDWSQHQAQTNVKLNCTKIDSHFRSKNTIKKACKYVIADPYFFKDTKNESSMMTKIKKLKEETLNLTTEHAFITLYFKQRHWDNLSITKEEFEVKINQVFKGVKIKLKSEFELHDRLLFSPNQLIILGNSFDNKNNTHITDFPIRYITEILKY